LARVVDGNIVAAGVGTILFQRVSPSMSSASRFIVFALILGLALGGFPSLRAQDDTASRRDAIAELYPVMIHALETKNFGRARNICDQVITWEPQNPVHHYNLACIEAQAGGTRLAYAFGALELAIALGFDDPDHLRADPDLAPLRSDPRFTELMRKTTNNANAGLALGSLNIPAPTAPTKPAKDDAPPASRTTGPHVPQPVAANFTSGIPVGLYFISRYWPLTYTVEKGAWYFAPDGSVYKNVEVGFSAEDLTAGSTPRGQAKLTGSKLEVTWSDGKISTGDIEREGNGFNWDMGIFTAVRAYDDATAVAGVYQGGESLHPNDNSNVVSKRLELRDDGTFTWEGVALSATRSGSGNISVQSSGTATGKWRLDGYSLVLTDSKGTSLRRLAFAYDDEATTQKPDRLFFGGLMYQKR
jgi:hypothetical protein